MHKRSGAVDFDWPEPTPTAQDHSERLIAHLRRVLDAGDGWMSFADYMREVLYAPGLGYYSAGAAKFGESGDFVTAPELSPLFGQTLGVQCSAILESLNADTIVEIGGGSGALATALMDVVTPGRYRFAEISADLRARQQSALARRHGSSSTNIDWLSGPQDLPPFDGVLLANEVLDALPVERFRMRQGHVEALGVRWTGTTFAQQPRPAGTGLTSAVRGLEQRLGKVLPDGYVSEIRPGLGAFVAAWAQTLRNGVMIWIDYGCSCNEYYAPDRSGGTLMCHYRQRAHPDPFVYPGLQDITAWVDFTALAEAGVSAGFELAGYTTQAHFLIGCGIEERFQRMLQTVEDESERVDLNGQVRRLLLPGEMGERFRVMAFARNLNDNLAGFSTRDLAAGL